MRKAISHYCPKTNLFLPVQQKHGRILQGRAEKCLSFCKEHLSMDSNSRSIQAWYLEQYFFLMREAQNPTLAS